MSLDYSKCADYPETLPEFTPEGAALLDWAAASAERLVKHVLASFLEATDQERLAMVTKYAYALNMAEAYFSDSTGGAEAMRLKDEGLLVLAESVERAYAWVELARMDEVVTH